MVRVRGLLAVGVCVVVLAGCSVDRNEPPGLLASPTVSQTPSPSPTPSATSTDVTATDLSDPELGIVFVDTPDLSGPAASAHDAVAIFRVEYWRSLTTGAVSPALVSFISPELLRKVESALQRDKESNYGYSGIIRISISDVVVDGATATASVCADYSDVSFTNADGSAPQSYVEVGSSQYERTTIRLSTFDDGVTWRPEDATFDGTSC